MVPELVSTIAKELGIQEYQATNAVQLLVDEECTIPFVARYRKERTGSLDEVKLTEIRDRYLYLTELEDTKVKYLKVVEEHCEKNPAFNGKYPELKAKFLACKTKPELEDLYLPFRPKRRTRAQIAREQGLEPLLDQILAQRGTLNDLIQLATAFLATLTASPEGKPEEKITTVEAALAGAADIFAERLSETPSIRAAVRNLSNDTGALVSKLIGGGATDTDAAAPAGGEADAKKAGKKAVPAANNPEAAKYSNYFEYRESLKTIPPHRVMAVRRGEAEKILRLTVEVDEAQILGEVAKLAIDDAPTTATVRQYLQGIVADAYKRLIAPAIETEIRMDLKTKAEEEAIKVFGRNLQNLLLLPPLPQTTVLGVDPGLRTGSKLAVVSETGKLLDQATVHPDLKRDDGEKTRQAMDVISKLIGQYNVRCVAIGNGTGSREIDKIVSRVIKDKNHEGVKRVVVNEAGASVYSTDQIAREEFPDLDPTIRSAISIARRLQDPLAELVKIDPRSIGVGQYQHDVNVTKLKRRLEDVVASCVNRVGVNLNTASYKLLSYVSGIGPTLAKNIVMFRDKNGRFQSRGQVRDVDGFGPKAFQLAAGFLRVPESPNLLDNSAVHPESYPIVEKIADDLKHEIEDLVGKKEIVETIPWETYSNKIPGIGLATLMDIKEELIKPGRDPREGGSRLLFSDDVADLEDLTVGMKLKGTVTNVTNFGAFVDIGVHQDGLVHISELSDQFVKDPNEVVAVGDVLDVRVIDVDKQRRRISLSCKSEQAAAGQNNRAQRPTAAAGGGGARPIDNGRPGDNRQQRGGGPPPRGDRGGNHPGNQPRPVHEGRQAARPKQPEKSFTVDDLVNKFKRK